MVSELEPGKVYDDVSELPRWIQILIDEAHDKGYKEGWDEGQANLWYQVERELKTVRPYSA